MDFRVIDEAASVSREQIDRLKKRARVVPTFQAEPGPNWIRNRFDTTTEGKLVQARTDFQTIIGWIDANVFDAEACRELCFAAIESLDGKG